MSASEDRKMFAPLRRREAVSPETKLCSVLAGYESGTVAATLAEALVHDGVAAGTRSSVTKRVAELLDILEDAGRVERIPDGRYRAIRPRPSSGRRA